MTYNNRNIESKNSGLHTLNKSKDIEITIEPENQAGKTGDSLLNGISEKGLSKNY